LIVEQKNPVSRAARVFPCWLSPLVALSRQRFDFRTRGSVRSSIGACNGLQRQILETTEITDAKRTK
jgi:hypothetical protein